MPNPGAFARYWQPCARVNLAGQVWETLSPEGLTIEWAADRNVAPSADTARVRIYNPSPTKARAVLTAAESTATGAFGATLDLAIGWDGVFARCFKGEIVRATYGPVGVDQILEVEADDGIRARQRSIVGRQISGSTIATAVELQITTPPNADGVGFGGLGLTIPPASLATLRGAAGASVPFRGLPVGLPTYETVQTLLASLGLAGRVSGDQFFIMRGDVINRPGPIFRPSTGLVSWRPREDGGCEITALGDPTCEPGIQIQAQDDRGEPLGAAFFRVERAVYSGSTMMGRSEMQISAAPGVPL